MEVLDFIQEEEIPPTFHAIRYEDSLREIELVIRCGNCAQDLKRVYYNIIYLHWVKLVTQDIDKNSEVKALNCLYVCLLGHLNSLATIRLGLICRQCYLQCAKGCSCLVIFGMLLELRGKSK